MKRLSCHNDALKLCVETPFLEEIVISFYRCYLLMDRVGVEDAEA